MGFLSEDLLHLLVVVCCVLLMKGGFDLVVFSVENEINLKRCFLVFHWKSEESRCSYILLHLNCWFTVDGVDERREGTGNQWNGSQDK